MRQPAPRSLFDIAQNSLKVPAELQKAWQILLRGIEHIPFEADDLEEVLSNLRRRRDYILEELGLEFIAGSMEVSFLDDSIRCDPAAFIALLEQLAEAGQAQAGGPSTSGA